MKQISRLLIFVLLIFYIFSIQGCGTSRINKIDLLKKYDKPYQKPIDYTGPGYKGKIENAEDLEIIFDFTKSEKKEVKVHYSFDDINYCEKLFSKVTPSDSLNLAEDNYKIFKEKKTIFFLMDNNFKISSYDPPSDETTKFSVKFYIVNPIVAETVPHEITKDPDTLINERENNAPKESSKSKTILWIIILLFFVFCLLIGYRHFMKNMRRRKRMEGLDYNTESFSAKEIQEMTQSIYSKNSVSKNGDNIFNQSLRNHDDHLNKKRGKN